jgi:hypothetical protein
MIRRCFTPDSYKAEIVWVPKSSIVGIGKKAVAEKGGWDARVLKGRASKIINQDRVLDHSCTAGLLVLPSFFGRASMVPFYRKRLSRILNTVRKCIYLFCPMSKAKAPRPHLKSLNDCL